jgi:5-methylcytosine-specific restriction endonuclease McrA
MKKHTKIYFEHYGYDISDFIPCEICGAKAVDIHHIDARGMGGSNKDNINNLMALCRECHLYYGDKKEFKDYLKNIKKIVKK